VWNIPGQSAPEGWLRFQSLKGIGSGTVSRGDCCFSVVVVSILKGVSGSGLGSRSSRTILVEIPKGLVVWNLLLKDEQGRLFGFPQKGLVVVGTTGVANSQPEERLVSNPKGLVVVEL